MTAEVFSPQRRQGTSGLRRRKARRKGMGGVFDHPQAMPAANAWTASMSIISPPTCTGMIPTTRQFAVQRRPAGLQVVELPLGVGQVHVRVTGSQSTSSGTGPLIADHLGRGGKGHGGHQHRLAGPQAQGLDRQVQGRRAGIDGQGIGFHRTWRRNAVSNCCVRGPVVSQPERRQATTSRDFRLADRGAEKRDLKATRFGYLLALRSLSRWISGMSADVIVSVTVHAPCVRPWPGHRETWSHARPQSAVLHK